MTEQAAPTTTGTTARTGKRERSPSFPYIPLEKAIERVRAMEQQHKQFEAVPAVVAKTWGITPKSSTFLQTIAALKAFGLTDDHGVGKNRKLRVSDLARRILHDTRPGAREAALKEAASKPKLLRDYAVAWRTGRPSDEHCISELTLERGFTQEAATNFVRVFDDTFRFANLGSSDSIADNTMGGAGTEPESDDGEIGTHPEIEVGDLIQVEIGGELQFEKPKRVRAMQEHEGRQWVFIEGSEAGIPMEQVIVDQKATEEGARTEPPILPEEHSPPDPGKRREVTSLDEGDAVLVWPESISPDSYHDLKAWLDGILNKARRRAGVPEKHEKPSS
ncbi:MAG: hypothetical protein ACE5JZ_07360 [Kiloniellales bacterium]